MIDANDLLPSRAAAAMCGQSRMFWRLSLDGDRRVRLAASQVLGAVAERVGKRLGPYVRSLIGPWACARFDVSAEVARAATDAFEVRRPPVFCRNAYGSR